ncbi:hypothetical protein CPB84DRAFT_839439 [Gymnopilus junonius]|uniref:Uncharacterized protein n=1 Tax=Gymnopilus junonius TaxID=109634 RepID=A0A9P5N708_GYMJU|nr:hypothetical protein CPB84DRAFT_839439 [Gymnopilus junonius]
MDVMGRWWDVRLKHSIPILVVNLVILVAYIYLSSKLYKVYANETFSRVGASPSIHRIYKIVLFFSVCLQLSGFFSIASTAIWLDKVCHSFLMELTEYVDLYMAAFIVTLVFQFPWFYLGWVCVRKECKVRFGIFCVISCILLALSSAFFSGSLYRYIFKSWPFFATITITAYLLLVTTSVLGVVCRLNFEKGLAHYLQVTNALEGVDFTPVSFPKSVDSDIEKNDFDLFKGAPSPTPAAPIVVQRPALSHREPRRRSVKERVSAVFSGDFYSKDPIKISSSPPLISELGPRPVFGGPRSSSMAPSAEPRPSIYNMKKSAVPKGKKDQSLSFPCSRPSRTNLKHCSRDRSHRSSVEIIIGQSISNSSGAWSSSEPSGREEEGIVRWKGRQDNDSSPKYAT